MSTSPRASLEAGETRSDTPVSTTSSLTLPPSNVNDDSGSTPPTSIGGDSAETPSQTEKQESPVHTTSEQPLNEVEMEEASAAMAMPPPATPATPASTRTLRKRTQPEGALDFDARMRELSGHKKRGPRRSGEVVKEERDAAAARRQTMSDIPAFDGNNNKTVNDNIPAKASTSRRLQTPDNPANSRAADIEMVAQGSVEGQSDALDGNDSTTKRACRVSKEERDAIAEAEKIKKREAQIQKKLMKANEEVARLQQKLNMIKQGEDPSKTAAQTPSPMKLKREVKRLEDTKEYKKKVEENVIVVEEIWSRGKKIVPGQPMPARKTRKAETEEVEVAVVAEKPKEMAPKGFTYRKEGIYVGTGVQTRKVLPLPMGAAGNHLMTRQRDFVLPYAICSPVVGRGHDKPPNWTNCSKNRFIGEADIKWKKAPKNVEDSRCMCSPDIGCDDSCHNRIMCYECSDDSCRVGRQCGNRPFADLAARTAKGGSFEVGVQVVKTGATGYGVRALRGFKPGQVIVEYCGEVITEEECERRMNECYKDDPCYYLMSFDQNMIIDAARRGSIARFVNHSCEPNCSMKKVFVKGEPRMALFALREVTTGEELTYDYNFHTFSQVNRQKCHCGAKDCRGFLMPKITKDKPKESQSVLENAEQAVRGGIQAMAKTAKGAANGLKTAGKVLKRKAAEIISPTDVEDTERAAVVKKRKTIAPQCPAKKAPLGAAINMSKRVGRSKGNPDDVASATPKLNTRSFLGVSKTNGTTVEKKQTKLSFFSSSAVSSSAAATSSSAQKRKATLALSPPLNEGDDSQFYVPDSETEHEDLDDVPEGMINIIRPIGGARKPLPSGPPAAAQGKGGNRLRLVVNPSPGGSAPGSGQSSREVSPGIPIVSAKQDLLNSKKPRWRAVMNKTPFVQPPAPTPGGPPVPKRIRKKKKRVTT